MFPSGMKKTDSCSNPLMKRIPPLTETQWTVRYISAHSEKLRRSAGLKVRQTSKLSVRTPRSGLFQRAKNLFDSPLNAAALRLPSLEGGAGEGGNGY